MAVWSGGGAAAFVGNSDEQVLGADELVLHPGRFGFRHFRHCVETRRQTRLRTAEGGWQAAEQLARGTTDVRGVRIHLAHEIRNDAVALLDQRDEQMLGLELRVVVFACQLEGGRHGLAGLFSVLVDVHIGSRLSAFDYQLSALSADS